jgi:hypothetical protein
MKMAGAAPFTLTVESVGHAAATVPVVVVVPGGKADVPVVVEAGAGVVPAGVVDAGAAVPIPAALLLAPPAVPLPCVFEAAPPPLGELPVTVPTVWPTPTAPLEQPIARTAGKTTAMAAARAACENTRIAFVRFVIGSPLAGVKAESRPLRYLRKSEAQAVIGGLGTRQSAFGIIKGKAYSYCRHDRRWLSSAIPWLKASNSWVIPSEVEFSCGGQFGTTNDSSTAE